jgi:hypothetical protein
VGPLTAVDPERIVVEVESLAEIGPPWKWFEIDMDSPATGAPPREPGAGAGFRISAMTTVPGLDNLAGIISRSRGTIVTHLQFPVDAVEQGRRGVEMIDEAGIVPLPMIHRDDPPAGIDELAAAIDLLAQLRAPIIKLAYSAPAEIHVDWGVRLLRSFRHDSSELAIVPMGTAAGRAAAYNAGSRLMWVPPRGDVDRIGADQLAPLLASPPAG